MRNYTKTELRWALAALRAFRPIERARVLDGDLSIYGGGRGGFGYHASENLKKQLKEKLGVDL